MSLRDESSMELASLEILHSSTRPDWPFKVTDPHAHSLIPQRQEKKLTLFFGISAIWSSEGKTSSSG